MSKVPNLPYTQIVRALQRDGWTLVRQKGSHLRLQKRTGEELLVVAGKSGLFLFENITKKR